jgi:hypothetical protein
MRTKILAATAALAVVAALAGGATAGSASRQQRSMPQVTHLLPGMVTSFAFDPVHPGTVYVGTNLGSRGRVYKSIDGGDHWRLIAARGWHWLNALAADPGRPGTLYAGTGNAVYKTTNSGRTWHAFRRGLLPPPGVNRSEGWVNWLAVDPTNSNIVYEHDYAQTIRKSTDGGHTWNVLLSDETLVPAHSSGAQTGLLMAPSRPPALYAAFGPDTYPSGPRGGKSGVYQSTNGGKTWRRMGLPAGGAGMSAADPQHNTVYVAVGARVFASTDAGQDWRFIGQGLPQDQAIGASPNLAPPGPGMAAGAGTVIVSLGKHGIYESSDDGRTWTHSWPVSGPAPGFGVGRIAVDPANPTTVYAAAYYTRSRSFRTHILRSTDSGRTWTVIG